METILLSKPHPKTKPMEIRFNGRISITLALAALGSAIQQASAGSVINTGSLSDARFGHTLTLLPNGKVLVAEGGGTSTEIYHPDSAGGAPSLAFVYEANQIMSFYWNGVGVLEQSDSLTTPEWQRAPIQDNPHTVTSTGESLSETVPLQAK